MVRYNPETLQALADKLQGEAALAIPASFIAGLFTGSLCGYAANLVFASRVSLLLPGLIAGGLLGIPIGCRKASLLRLKAQMAVCQIRIEENTRKAGGA